MRTHRLFDGKYTRYADVLTTQEILDIWKSFLADEVEWINTCPGSRSSKDSVMRRIYVAKEYLKELEEMARLHPGTAMVETALEHASSTWGGYFRVLAIDKNVVI